MKFRKTGRILCFAVSLILGIGLCSGCNTEETDASSDGGTGISTIVSSTEGTDSSSEETEASIPNEMATTAPGNAGNPVSTKTTTGKSSTTAQKPAGKTSLTRDQVMAKMPAKLKNTTINYFYWNDPYANMEKEVYENFTKLTGIKVVYQQASYADYLTELSTRVASGKSPDMVRMLNNSVARIKSLQPIRKAVLISTIPLGTKT